MSGAHISNGSLIIASSLVFISLAFSYFQKLKLEKEIFISVIRAVVQLIILGYVLEYIFGLDNPVVTTALLLFMTFNAAYNAAKRSNGMKYAFAISFISIILGAGATISVLIISKAIIYTPAQLIPVGGMIISNSMVALGLCYKQIASDFNSRGSEIETKLALGADILPSSIEIIRDSIRTGMIPTIDSAKTVGIVSIPGMMTGLILAGTSPLEAIKYQIMVTFMILSTTAISSFIACFFSYRTFFNSRKQLISLK